MRASTLGHCHRGRPTVIVHLLEFRVVPGHEAEVVGFLRNAAPCDRSSAGLLTCCIGRRLGRHQSELVVVTGWRDHAAFTSGTDALGVPTFFSPKASLLGERRSLAFDVSASMGDGPDGSRILRVDRALVSTADVELWERRSEEQLTRMSETDGLLCLRAGVGLADADPGGAVPVVALSAWRDWEAVLVVTGGHIGRLVQDTELIDLEHSGSVGHYEVLESAT
jgi:hypothetical protein